ncbi:hypothetical protein F2Q69_00057605 [Brassica cretica]|uniref:Uncharacterized protein n=1 Tax=Brassica cretica TaxID=69181 RepID=A0A8S9MZP8_BRACR|nr:hypothetical protein F2Q69_00057605 [Brassica cretica]
MAMEIATPAPAPITSPEINIILSPAKTENHKKNMIQVSNTKKPLFFDVNLAKREIGLVDLVLIPERSLAFICPPKGTFSNTMRSSSLHSEWCNEIRKMSHKLTHDWKTSS